MRPRFLPAGWARRRAGRPRLPSSTKSRICSPGGLGDERAEGKAMIARSLADLLVRQQRAARIGALRTGRRPAPPDAEERALMRWLDEQVSGDAVLRITDGGDVAPDRPSGQPEARWSGGSGRWARSAGPKAEDQPPLGAVPDLAPTCYVALRSAGPSLGCRHHLHPDGPRLPP